MWFRQKDANVFQTDKKNINPISSTLVFKGEVCRKFPLVNLVL